MSIGGISAVGDTGFRPRWWWKDATEGLDDNGGEGNPTMRGVGNGLLRTEGASDLATLGD